jgi:hypothetical protein
VEVIKGKLVGLISTIALIASSLGGLPAAYAAAPGSLGIGVDVLKATATEDTTLGADGSLWFLLPPGNVGTRSFRVNSVANIPMHISVSLGFGQYRDGIAAFDDSKKSDIANWARFSESEFSLNPGASKVVSITFSIPKDAQIKANLATVFVKGLGLNVATNKSGFSVGGAARVAIPVFLGVGTADQISINFKILRTSIKNVEGKRLAFIRIKNVGKTPVAPAGFIKVLGQGGGISIPQPIKVQSSTVIPGEARDVIFLIPAYIPNGKWTFMEEFQQGPVSQTAQADIALTKPSIFTKANLFRFFIFLLSLIILYLSLRYLRKTKQEKVTPQEEDLIELELALEKIRKKNLHAKTAKRAPLKKSAANKSSIQKKSLKKTVKQSPVKKAAAKKNASKSSGKTVAKKKATKKAAVKKI